MITTMILFVAFGQITVRRLRKHSATKYSLGRELAKGWDILNVAEALSLPKGVMRILENSPLGFLYAESEIIRRNTNFFDKVLGVTFFWFFIATSVLTIGLALHNFFFG